MRPEEGIKKLRDASMQELAARYTQFTGRVCLTRDPKGHTLFVKAIGNMAFRTKHLLKCGCSPSGQADGEGS